MTAGKLKSLVNGYRASSSGPRTITVRKASQLAALGEITVTGWLLKKQIVTLDRSANQRQAALTAQDGRYKVTSGDGDLHFCLGTQQLKPHIACEIQNAQSVVQTFRDAVGGKITVSGFFAACLSVPASASTTTPTSLRFIRSAPRAWPDNCSPSTSTYPTRRRFTPGPTLIC